MNEPPSPEQPLPSEATPAAPVVRCDFVARAARRQALIEGVLAGAIVVGLVHAVVTRGAGGGLLLMLGLTALVLVERCWVLRRPPRVQILDDQLVFDGRLYSPPNLVAQLFFDGDALRVLFVDLDRFEPPRTARILKRKRQLTGSDLYLPGFTLAQVDEIRRAAGLAPPPPDEPAGQVERFAGTLAALTPRPWVVPLLLAANVLVFLLMALSGVSLLNPSPFNLIRWGANFGPLTTHGEWWRLFTGMFVHIGFLHLLGNLWALGVFGRLFERLTGSMGCLLLYLLAGLVGSLTSLYWHPKLICAGASGAIFGLFGGVMGFILSHRSEVPLGLVRDLRNSGVVFLGINVLIGLTTPEIDLSAHLGGAIAGFVGGLLLAQPLDAAAGSRRRRHNLLLALTGSAALAVGLALVPTVPTGRWEWLLAMQELDRVHEEVLPTYDAAARRTNRGEMAEGALADLVEREVLPPWGDITARVAALDDVPERFEPIRPLLLDSLRARQEAWELLVQGIRRGDNSLRNQAHEKWRRADELLNQAQQKKR